LTHGVRDPAVLDRFADAQRSDIERGDHFVDGGTLRPAHALGSACNAAICSWSRPLSMLDSRGRFPRFPGTRASTAAR
jgi:hypothetical protein